MGSVFYAIWHSLRQLDWLNGRRLTIYPKLFLAIYAFAIVLLLATSQGGVDFMGRVLGNDFIVFWSASTLAERGDAADAYQPGKLSEVQQEAFPDSRSYYVWLYPPTSFLIVQPLANLPYFIALGVWTFLTLAALCWLARRLVPHPQWLWLTLAFPGCLQNLLQGQNGFLTAFLFGSGIYFLDRRPWLSGVLIGFLTYKPQFGLLIPLVLLATGRWAVFVSATATTIVFALATIPILGLEVWRAFLDSLGFTAELLAVGAVPWEKMVSLYASLRQFGAPLWLGMTIHGLFALIIAVMTLLIWRSRASFADKASILVLGALLVSPYSYDYDMVLLGLPLAWLGWQGYQNGFRPWEKAALLANWVIPIFVRVVSIQFELQIGWLVPAWLLWLLWYWQRERSRSVSPALSTA